MARSEFRLRVRYCKVGRLAWLSHLEVARTLERSVRRAVLRYALTQGFNPHMKIAFGPALPVGTAGESEYYDVWLTEYTTAEEALRRLAEATPEDLAPLAAKYVDEREPALAAATTIATYRVLVGGRESSSDQVRAALEKMLASGTLTVRRKGKEKVFDLARSLPKEVRVSSRDDGSEVALTVRLGPEGSLRPEMLVSAALEAASLDASVANTARTETLVESPEGSWVRPA